MSLFVERKIPSDLGEIEIAVTRLNHISARANYTVRDCEYSVHGHYFLVNDAWVLRTDNDISISGTYSQANRNNWDKRPAPTIRQKIVDVMTTAVRAYAKANRNDFPEAEEKRLTNDIASHQAKIAEKQDELEKMQQELASMERDLAAVQQAVVKA